MKIYLFVWFCFFLSCSKTLHLSDFLKKEPMAFLIDNFENERVHHIYAKSKENQRGSFICEKERFTIDLVCGRYDIFYYCFEPQGQKYTLYFYDYQPDFLHNGKNQCRIVKRPVDLPALSGVYCRKQGQLELRMDSTYEFFSLYSVSSLSIKEANGKKKGYTSKKTEDDILIYYFSPILLNEAQVILNISYSIKSNYDKLLLSDKNIAVTTTRLENIDITHLISFVIE